MGSEHCTFLKKMHNPQSLINGTIGTVLISQRFPMETLRLKFHRIDFPMEALGFKKIVFRMLLNSTIHKF